MSSFTESQAKRKPFTIGQLGQGFLVWLIEVDPSTNSN
jgi:hypothetical protein